MQQQRDPADIRARIASHHPWYHSIELALGIVTPGIHDSAAAIPQLEAMGFPGDLTAKRVLDIGCRDGFFTFEAERRGADVVAIDYADPEVTGFAIASEILGSKVDYHTENVYDVRPETYGRFDLILFLGVLYHLRNPLLALDRLRAMAVVGGEIIVETEISTDAALVDLKTPAFEFLPRDQLAGDPSNVWAPNMAGLLAALEECQFTVLAAEQIGNRGWAQARAVDDGELERSRRLDSSRGRWGRA